MLHAIGSHVKMAEFRLSQQLAGYNFLKSQRPAGRRIKPA